MKADRTSDLSFGTRFNNYVNQRLDGQSVVGQPGVEHPRDSYSRVVSRDSLRGAQVLSAPRYFLNLFAGGTQLATDPKSAPDISDHRVQRSAGVVHTTLSSFAMHLADGVGGVCGTVGTVVGLAAGVVAPVVSDHRPEDVVKDTARWSSNQGRQLTSWLLRGASWLVTETVGLACGVATGVLAGIGCVAGGAWGALVHGPAASLRAAFRREAADAAHSAGATPTTRATEDTPELTMDEIAAKVRKHEAMLQPIA